MATFSRQGVRGRCLRNLGVLVVLLAGACTLRKPVAPPVPPPMVIIVPPPAPKATPGLAPAERLKLVIRLAARGEFRQAELEVDAYLLDKPNSALGQSLKRQLDIDPKTYLGTRSFPYALTSGETLATVAERFMGDRYRFIGLARYNNISVPERAQAGQIIQVPGTPPAAAAGDRAIDDEREIEQRLAQENKPPPAPEVVVPKIRLPTAEEIIRAGQLRQTALEQLQRGFADRAAKLLEEALKLYPTSVKIVRDLDRARRLQALTRRP